MHEESSNESLNESFRTLCLVSTYLYLKDKYPQLQVLGEEKDKDILAITERLKQFAQYAHVANKKKLIRQSYEMIATQKIAEDIDEEEILSYVRQHAKNLTTADKDYVFECLVTVARADGKISTEAKEVVCQVGLVLDIENPAGKLSRNGLPWYAPAGIIALVVVLVVSAYFVFSGGADQKINTFRKHDIVFSEIFFNRFLIYTNSFAENNNIGLAKYMARMAVWYLSGSAEITFKPSQLHHDPATNKLVLTCNTDSRRHFDMKTHFNQPLIIDEMEPEEISKEEAEKVAGVIGIAAGTVGAVAGGVAGNAMGGMIKEFLPPGYQVLAKPVGAVTGALALGAAGGAAGYFVTVNALEGRALARSISPGEKDQVTKSAQQIMTATLAAEAELAEMYKQKFKAFITAEYAMRGITVSDIDYDDCPAPETKQ